MLPTQTGGSSIQKFIRVNHRIRVPEVRVIDAEGKQVGILPTSKAMELALRQGLDLVEVSPTANPPVCRIVDFGKFRYEMSKKEKHGKAVAASRVKELKFHLNIDPHDFGIKMNHARGFLAKGMRVKMSLVFRGREMMHATRGVGLVDQIQTSLAEVAHAEAPPRMIGRAIHLMMVPAHGKKFEKPLPVEGLRNSFRSNYQGRPGAPGPSGSTPPPASRSSSFGQGVDISKLSIPPSTDAKK